MQNNNNVGGTILCSFLIFIYVWQLGAGTSLPGLVAAKVGAHVTLTDIAHNTEVSYNPYSESLLFLSLSVFQWLISDIAHNTEVSSDTS
jgi:hypothetical protein